MLSSLLTSSVCFAATTHAYIGRHDHTLIRRYHCNFLMVIHLPLHFGSHSDWTLLTHIYRIAIIDCLVYICVSRSNISRGPSETKPRAVVVIILDDDVQTNRVVHEG